MFGQVQNSCTMKLLLSLAVIALLSSRVSAKSRSLRNGIHVESASVDHHQERQRRELAEGSYNLEKAKTLANNVANLVYQRFEFNHTQRFQFFIEASNMPEYGWDILKYKIAKKIVDGGSSFLMIFGGSSVTAGHDNYYNQSWPFVFERRVKPIFDALGINLLVHNIAQGANNCRPAANCYDSMGGDNADFIGWEQSFNCGKSKDIFELMARVAYWNGGVAYYSASGAFLPKDCAKSTDKLYWTSEDWTPEFEGIKERYTMTPSIVSAYRTMQNEWFNDGNSVSRFSAVYGPLYKGVGPHGFSVWGHSSTLCNNGTGCTAIDVKGDCQERGGPHWMVQETAWYANDPNKHGREWHPSAGMHLLRGEILAYNYVHIVMDAILQVEHNLTHSTKEAASKYYQDQIDLLRLPIPERALYISVEESKYPPICYTNYEPHFNPNKTLARMIVGNHTGWNYVHKYGSWGDGDSIYGYKDTRPCWEGHGASQEIYVRLLGVRMNSVKVCGYSSKESLKHALFLVDGGVTVPFRDKTDPVYGTAEEYSPSDKRVLVSRRRYVQDECTQLFDIPNGDSVLTIRTDPEHPQHTSSLSHVIIF